MISSPRRRVGRIMLSLSSRACWLAGPRKRGIGRWLTSMNSKRGTQAHHLLRIWVTLRIWNQNSEPLEASYRDKRSLTLSWQITGEIGLEIDNLCVLNFWFSTSSLAQADAKPSRGTYVAVCLELLYIWMRLHSARGSKLEGKLSKSWSATWRFQQS